MTTDHQRRGLASDLGRRFQSASFDELRVIDRAFTVLEQRRHRVGPLDISEHRDWKEELGEGLLCAVTYCAIETMRAEDQARAELRDAARREMLREVELPAEHEHGGEGG